MYCVFNENLIVQSYSQHIRQMKEDKQGKRYPLAKDRQAIIRKKDGLYYGIINKNEVIAISDDVETVYKRLSLVDRDIDIVIRHKKRSYETLESYKNSLLPAIYRITSSNKKDHSLIIAMNRVKSNQHSSIRLFYDVEELISYFEQLKSKNYYVHVAHFRDISREDKKRMGGIDALDIPWELRDMADMRAAIKEREKAGSHEEYMRQREQSKARVSRHNQYYYDGERDWEELNDEQE